MRVAGRPQMYAAANRYLFLAPGSEKYLLQLTRKIKESLSVLPGRTEMTVVKDFKQGHRWAKMLGFVLETLTLRAYGPAGEDHSGYVRIQL